MRFAGRMHLYFREMFPLPRAVLSTLLIFYSFFFTLSALGGNAVLFQPAAAYALLSILLFWTTFRLNDELKDEEFDKVHNPRRPMVTGLVRYSDIRLTAVVLSLVMTALNFDRGFVTSAFLLLMVFLLLSARWFYFPETVQKYFLLTTITHQPMLPLLYFYVFATYNALSAHPLPLSWSIVGLCLLFSISTVAWEVSRKIKAPSDETDYPSYSRRWGVRPATLMPMGYIALSTIGFTLLGFWLGFSRFYLVANVALGVGVLVVFARFLIRPSRERNHLKAANEVYEIGFRLLIIADVLASRLG